MSRCSEKCLKYLFPELSKKKIKDALLFCSKGYPNEGVTIKEMNETLGYLKPEKLIEFFDLSKKKNKQRVSDIGFKKNSCLFLIDDYYYGKRYYAFKNGRLNEKILGEISLCYVSYYWEKK